MTKVDEIVYAKWDTTSFWYLAQVVSVSMGSKTTTYTLHFMDGFDKQGAAEKKLKKVPAREKKNKPIGKNSSTKETIVQETLPAPLILSVVNSLCCAINLRREGNRLRIGVKETRD